MISACSVRAAIAAVVTAAALFIAGAAGAQQTYYLTGRFLDQDHRGFRLPVQGDAACPGFVWGQRQAVHPTMPNTPPKTQVPQISNWDDGGCVPGADFITTANRSPVAGAVGGKVTVPTQFFSQPAPGAVNAAAAPSLASIQQVATSFGWTGPVSPPLSPIGATMSGTAPYAAWRVFHASAWASQTGRAGPTFTWCPDFTGGAGVTGCTSPPASLLIKNVAGPNGFGGTMSLLQHVGTNPSHLFQLQPNGGTVNSMSIRNAPLEPCLGLAGGCTKSVVSRGAGRGYAAYMMGMTAGGTNFTSYQLTTANPPQSALVAAVGATQSAGTTAIRTSVNFPWTTGRVIARATGMTLLGGSKTSTITASGADSATGGGRNIQLVTGKVTKVLVGGSTVVNYATAGQLNLPEPRGATLLLSGVAGLLAIASWRSRRRARASRRG